MNVLQQYSAEELQRELARREVKQPPGKPKILDNPDFGELTDLCVKYVDGVDAAGWVDDDLEHYIFEAAMTALFGKPLWPWINQKMK